MELNDRYREALKKITDELLSMSPEEFYKKLEEQKDGKFSKIIKHYGLEIAFPELPKEKV